MVVSDRKVGAWVVRAGQRLRTSAFVTRLAGWAAVALGWWLALFVADNLLRLPAGLRFPLAVGGAAIVAAAATRLARTLRRRSPEAVAVLLEQRFAVGHNALINAMQLERRPVAPDERPFAERALGDGRALLPNLALGRLWDRRRLGRWGAGAGLLLAAWVAYLALFPRHAVNAAFRYIRPMADRPPVGSLALTVVPGGDVVVAEGDDLEVTAVVAVRAGAPPASAPAPTVAWVEGPGRIEPDPPEKAERAAMATAEGQGGAHRYTFARVHRPFSFRVYAGDTYSAAVAVGVRPRPKIVGSWVEVAPPAYTGRKAARAPGPPAPIAGLVGSAARIGLAVAPGIDGGAWVQGTSRVALARTGAEWTAAFAITGAAPFEIVGREPGLPRDLALARGEVLAEPDRPPEIDFTTAERNQLVALGATVRLDLEARDDFGLRVLGVTARTSDAEGGGRVLKEWAYVGPPGVPGPVREGFDLAVDPAVFEAGRTYLVEALAYDFAPGGRAGVSRPLVLRVKSTAEYALEAGDPLAAAFERLRATVSRQEKALGFTGNLALHLDEAEKKDSVGDHRRAISRQQEDARAAGLETLGLFRKEADGAPYAGRLAPLVEGEMPWVLNDLLRVEVERGPPLAARVKAVHERQSYILSELLALLGRIAGERRDARAARDPNAKDDALPVTRETMGEDLHDALREFSRDQERILSKSRTLLDKAPSDLTEEEQKILGELAREEAEWASFFEEKLTDFSKLPNQDFADGSLAAEINEVYQDIQKAAAELYEKKIELAVPHEQSGLEKAAELQHNLEKWLSDVPDNLKWMMEDPLTPPDIPMAELPAELEDIVGELLDQEAAMTEDVEDVTSSWMDSIDKGAGWTAMDGPISSMSAKGITGNLLPNNQEVGGRSGEGRTGKSMGQMVEDSAVGKDGRQTPTRLTPTPFEQGSVQDSSTGDPGGATGGGKLSGYSAEGLRGPAPPPMNQNLPRLAQQQAKIRQEAEDLALKLRAFKYPSGDVEASIHHMAAVEDAVVRRDGLGVRQAHSRALDALKDAGRTLRTEKGLQRERTQLPEWIRNEILSGYRDGLPRGYEEIVAAYFRTLAEEAGPAPAPPPARPVP